MGRVPHVWYMARNATEELYVSPETKQLVLEQKPDGLTQDAYVRHAVKHAPPVLEDGGRR